MSINSDASKAKIDAWGFDYHRRQTGRTTRMFEAAKAMAESGKPVTVLMKDEQSADCWRGRGWEVPGLEIIILHCNDLNTKGTRINWITLRMTDHRANNVLFIDHDVLYIRFKDILKAFMQYDNVVEDIPLHVQNAAEITLAKKVEVSLSIQEEAIIEPLKSLKNFGDLSFSEYEEIVENMLSAIVRNVSSEETDNPALFCYTVGKLKHKLLDDWRSNYGSATAG